jgi:dTDP-4-dehydrorhamnose 3,5-epimerase
LDVKETDLEGVLVFVPERHEDARGSFVECFREDWLRYLPAGTGFVRDGQTSNPAVGTVRGLHAQRGLGKLVRAASGSVYDVVVDLRDGSPSWGRHVAVTLSARSGRVLWVPPGFAHGYATLVADTSVHYRFTAGHEPGAEVGVRWNDPALGIDWPVDGAGAVISDRDRALPLLGELSRRS